MSEDSIKKVLRDFGLTEKETEIYIFVAKHGALRGGEISKRTKTHRGLIYRILGSLQSKGLVESTLESPTRFQAVPFETILDLSIKTKREEAAQIETKKMELLNYWRKNSQIVSEPSLEKFNVIEGKNRIYSKIAQMLKDTENGLCIISPVADLIRTAQLLGFFERDMKRPSGSKIQYRMLTDLSSQNFGAIKTLLKEMNTAKVRFEGRTPTIGLGRFPRMIIRDEKEAIFFISPNQGASRSEQDDTCLCTNSKALVQTLTGVFEGLWKNSTELQTKLIELETGNFESQTLGITDTESARKQYEETINLAKKSILILTSAEGLKEYSECIDRLKDWSSRGISVKIMAPITAQNMKTAQDLMRVCSVRHIHNSYSRVLTVVDGKYSFQFCSPPPAQEKIGAMPYTGFTNNLEYVRKTEEMLNDLWINAPAPSTTTLESILREAAPFSARSDGSTSPILKMEGHRVIDQKSALAKNTEEDLLKRFMSTPKHPNPDSSKEFVGYCSSGQAVVHLPRSFNMPDLLMFAIHFEKHSSFGEEDVLILSLWLETPKGYAYVPVAVIQDNPRATDVWRRYYDKSPAGNNILLVKGEELQMRMHGNTFFAGWSIPIPLLPPKYILQPGCILLETYGQARYNSYTLITPAGFKSKIESNGLMAFVTFLSSTSNYSGPGTDGFVARDQIMTTTAP